MSTKHAYRRPYDARVRRGLPVRLIGAPPAVIYATIGSIFLFTDANWNSDLQFFLEASFRATSGTAFIRLLDITTDTAVSDSTISISSSDLTRVRSDALTLIDGNEYRFQVGQVGTGAGAVVGAKVIVIK